MVRPQLKNGDSANNSTSATNTHSKNVGLLIFPPGVFSAALAVDNLLGFSGRLDRRRFPAFPASWVSLAFTYPMVLAAGQAAEPEPGGVYRPEMVQQYPRPLGIPSGYGSCAAASLTAHITAA
jgi:hypothetical protein